ncbi:hypothetical protein [Herbaspirillum huttiense]|uniref:CopG family transcriptional regulator n=1 Tax=Herbaspirillum huttiense subsp. lycopersici TaxID=3074428 RepID=A0ABU2EQV5_9BURK|nr:hypothetical protein [Herbaspirillum huttiense]MDR9850218.1 hypothetical protein [Herbaspirillum huttiense SE1]
MSTPAILLPPRNETDIPATREVTSVVMTTRLDSREAEKVSAYAVQDHRTRSSFLRLMVLKGIQAYEKEHQSATA